MIAPAELQNRGQPHGRLHASEWREITGRVEVRGRHFSWKQVLWAFLYPPRGHRVLPTVSGVVLITLALGLGMAAYNTANNILFITLSLLLACLILNGVMSWLNFRGLSWRVCVAPPLRVREEAVATIDVRNRKRVLPVYGVWFDIGMRGGDPPKRVYLAGRVDPEGQERLEWRWRPARRGRAVVQLSGVGSLFPFGFLRKQHGETLEVPVIVWPAPVSYRRQSASVAGRSQVGSHTRRVGHSSDLLALRRYVVGDSHRLIHWKASARSRQLLVRQFAAEGHEGFFLWLDTPADRWCRPEQFETLCCFAASLAEDLFREGRLVGAAINGMAPLAVRSLRDLEEALDRIAVIEPVEPDAVRTGEHLPHNLLTFAPDGPRGVAAYIDGELAASA